MILIVLSLISWQLVAAQVPLDSFSLQRFSLSSTSTTPESHEKESSNTEASKTAEANESGPDSESKASAGKGAVSESDSESGDDGEEMSKDDLMKLVAEKEELLSVKEEEIKKMKDKVLRTYAEMENVMDRTRRDAENTKKYALQVCLQKNLAFVIMMNDSSLRLYICVCICRILQRAFWMWRITLEELLLLSKKASQSLTPPRKILLLELLHC